MFLLRLPNSQDKIKLHHRGAAAVELMHVCVCLGYGISSSGGRLDTNAIDMDTLGIEPRASRMLSGCDTTTPCARESAKLVREAMANEWAHVRSTYASDKIP